MAKFLMDDGKTIMSTDQILKLFSSGGNNNVIDYNVEKIGWIHYE